MISWLPRPFWIASTAVPSPQIGPIERAAASRSRSFVAGPRARSAPRRRPGTWHAVHHTLAARAGDPQPPLANALDVLAPRIGQPNVVPRSSEQPAIDRPHGSRTNNGDFHDFL